MMKLTKVIVSGLVDELNELMKHPVFEEMDFSDLGNTIGATIGGEGVTEDDKELLECGLKHGFSIADGTHG